MLGCCNSPADLQLCSGGCALPLMSFTGSECGLKPCCFRLCGMCCSYWGVMQSVPGGVSSIFHPAGVMSLAEVHRAVVQLWKHVALCLGSG